MTGGAIAAMAVILGAFGAHALRATLDAGMLATWHTAVDYQFWHALGLLALTRVCAEGRAAAVLAFWSFVVGITIFCGSLYAIAAGAPRGIGVLTPIGGLALIAGWVALVDAFRRNRPA
jgi:uncharacterized membrane protein YgdD (TMEM256/DUF423 family)